MRLIDICHSMIRGHYQVDPKIQMINFIDEIADASVNFYNRPISLIR